MKQAKFALTAVALFAVIGGALAFKANRISRTFYKFGVTTTAGGLSVTGCVLPYNLSYIPASSGLEIQSSSAFNTDLPDQVCTAIVASNA